MGKKSTAAILKERIAKLNEQRAAAKAAVRKAYGSVGYYNLAEGEKNKFKVLIPSTGPLFEAYLLAKGTKDGKFTPTMSLTWMHENDDFLNFCLESGKWTPDDTVQFEKFGDPFTVLQKACEVNGKDFKDSRGWPIFQSRYMFMVLDLEENDVGIFEVSPTFGDSILDSIALDQSLLEFPGRGFSARKKKGQAPNAPVTFPIAELPLIEETVPNIHKILSSRVLHYEDLVQFMLTSYSDLANEVGLSQDNFR